MAKGNPNLPKGKLALYEKLISTQPGIERKGATMPYTSLNGHMFSFLTAEGALALRLPTEARQEFMSRFKAEQITQHGVVMKEYVSVPEHLFSNAKELAQYFSASTAYIRTLKPKPTKGSR